MTVPDSVFSTGTVVVAIWVSEPGNPTGKFVVVYRRTVTGCVPPAPVAVSMPKEAEVMLYGCEPAKVAMLNALQ